LFIVLSRHILFITPYIALEEKNHIR